MLMSQTLTDLRHDPYPGVRGPAASGTHAPPSLLPTWVQQAWTPAPTQQNRNDFSNSPQQIYSAVSSGPRPTSITSPELSDWIHGTPLQVPPIINVSVATPDEPLVQDSFGNNTVSVPQTESVPMGLSSSAPDLYDRGLLDMDESTVQPSIAGQTVHPTRRAELRHPRTYLKVDVNMGFATENRNESPTMLHPVSNRNKRRSISDVGPRTPSMLGFSPDTDMSTSLDDLIGILGAVPQQREGVKAEDNALNFESLNLKTEDDASSSLSFGNETMTPEPVSSKLSSLESLFDNSTVQLPNELQPQHSPVTLDPSLIQQNKAIDEALLATLEPSMPAAGPIRLNSGVRSHGSSPYLQPRHLPSDGAADSIRSWRFPAVLDARPEALHPMDAYTRKPDYGAVGGMRDPSTGRGSRRHIRAALSEDLRSMTHKRSLGGADNSSRWALEMIPAALVEANGAPAPRQSMDSSTRAGGRHVKSASVQCATLTHTPVVTTSASQAASASRRKAEAQYVCPFPDCTSTFTRQYNLRGHMRSHMDQRPFKCDWPGCGRSFARTHDCKRHQNLHLNIKPYSCEACGKTFARLDALNRHHKSEGGACGTNMEN